MRRAPARESARVGLHRPRGPSDRRPEFPRPSDDQPALVPTANTAAMASPSKAATDPSGRQLARIDKLAADDEKKSTRKPDLHKSKNFNGFGEKPPTCNRFRVRGIP